MTFVHRQGYQPFLRIRLYGVLVGLYPWILWCCDHWRLDLVLSALIAIVGAGVLWYTFPSTRAVETTGGNKHFKAISELAARSAPSTPSPKPLNMALSTSLPLLALDSRLSGKLDSADLDRNEETNIVRLDSPWRIPLVDPLSVRKMPWYIYWTGVLILSVLLGLLGLGYFELGPWTAQRSVGSTLALWVLSLSFLALAMSVTFRSWQPSPQQLKVIGSKAWTDHPEAVAASLEVATVGVDEEDMAADKVERVSACQSTRDFPEQKDQGQRHVEIKGDANEDGSKVDDSLLMEQQHYHQSHQQPSRHHGHEAHSGHLASISPLTPPPLPPQQPNPFQLVLRLRASCRLFLTRPPTKDTITLKRSSLARKQAYHAQEHPSHQKQLLSGGKEQSASVVLWKQFQNELHFWAASFFILAPVIPRPLKTFDFETLTRPSVLEVEDTEYEFIKQEDIEKIVEGHSGQEATEVTLSPKDSTLRSGKGLVRSQSLLEMTGTMTSSKKMTRPLIRHQRGQSESLLRTESAISRLTRITLDPQRLGSLFQYYRRRYSANVAKDKDAHSSGKEGGPDGDEDADEITFIVRSTGLPTVRVGLYGAAQTRLWTSTGSIHLVPLPEESSPEGGDDEEDEKEEEEESCEEEEQESEQEREETDAK